MTQQQEVLWQSKFYTRQVYAPSKENFTFTPQDNEECPCLNCDYLEKDKHDPETCGPEQIRHCPRMDGWLDKRLKRQAA